MKKQYKRLVILTIALVVALVLVYGVIATIRIVRAEKRCQAGDVVGALQLLNAPDPISKAKRRELCVKTFGEEFVASVRDAKAGDVITFGNYEQDEIYENGYEPLEWIVLEKRSDGKLLLISKYVLECVRYNWKSVDVTWETCSLREWLNTTFMDLVFTAEEKCLIPYTKVVNEDNDEYGTEGGNDTEDRIFLLSVEEATQYFSANSERKTTGTRYALLHYAYTDAFGHTPWWLRTPSFRSDMASLVSDEGEVMNGAYHKVADRSIGVRPCIILDPA